MDAFLVNISSFPTIIYTILVGSLIVYWILLIMGIFDFDFLEVDIDMDADADVDEMGKMMGFLATCGLTGVPIMIVATLLIIIGWLVSYYASLYGMFWVPDGVLRYAAGCGVIVVSFGVSIIVTATLIRPMRPFFRRLNASPSNKSMVGMPCIIRTTEVTDTKGEATCSYNGASMLIKVRAATELPLKRGDNAVIVEYDPSKSLYFVVTEQEFKQGGLS
ncbi:MAG: hypothetical protein CMF25_07375 [Kangiellaceae bacterium]|nr:hypothetical protein [Kangiellaceae bacterium]|tara:strand:+ start:2244 stop:2900 length:657 start_codon:yes stop_codon:yes gene_type:complete